ncbi:hypothetical protein B4O97_18905 [Marispirochaeta aestuarii]|uniref:Flagellar protein FliL n=1 Tax=Marispirochaeta aestuarii TaxID=1963862 RepID=A0A1Y1RSU4_9SPIO|nr:hypothetical protein [Marispirochaeta aestuarii]ORC29593.1 hypothetical protein B4O97_18905 [Marispirochaeta aestuarii]
MKKNLIIVLFLLIAFTSCLDAYTGNTSVLCLTNDYEYIRLEIDFSMDVSKAQTDNIESDTLEMFIVDYVSSSIEIYLLDIISNIEFSEVELMIDNQRLNEMLLDHLNSLPRLNGDPVRSVSITISSM